MERRRVGAHRVHLGGVADQAPVRQQGVQVLVAHHPHAARLEALEGGLEGRPPGVDHGVPQARPEDPERHQREVAVVAHGAQLGGRFRPGQARPKRRRAAGAGLGRPEDRLEIDHGPAMVAGPRGVAKAPGLAYTKER